MKNEKVRNAMEQVKKWIYKHEIISSSVLTLMIGLVIGGISVVLEMVLV